MSIVGKMQTPRGVSLNTAYSLSLHITDENGIEIADDTKIRITKEATSDYIIQLARVYYSDLKMQNNDSVVNSQSDIRSENVRFKLETDIWNINT